MNRAIFLDRDGLITFAGVHIYKIEDLKFIEGVFNGLRKLQKLDYLLIVITNQAGIAKGMYEEKDYFAFRNEMHGQLKGKGIIINAEYFCPHHLQGTIEKYKIDCNCRKPKSGMLEQAARDFDLDLEKCWMLGDTSSDIQAGKNAGCKTIHVLTGEGKIPSDYADFVANNLVEASSYIFQSQ